MQAQSRKVKVSERTIVLPYSRRAIPIKFRPFAGDADVNFRPSHNQSTAYLSLSGAFLESVCSNSTSAVFYHNKTDRPVIFPRSLPIGELSEFEAETEALFLDAGTAQSYLGDPFFAAECHPPVFPFPSAVVGMHWSRVGHGKVTWAMARPHGLGVRVESEWSQNGVRGTGSSAPPHEEYRRF